MWYSKNVIPKKIFQTHEWEYEDLPDFMKAATQTWINMNPTWEYVYMNAKERRAYVNEHHPELIQMYDIVPGLFQCDMWRYIVLYNNGGTYADIDSICIKSLDKMLDEKYTDQEIVCFLGKVQDNNFINSANFMSTKMSSVVKESINAIYLKSENIKKKLEEKNKFNKKNDFHLQIFYPAFLHTIYRTEWKRATSPMLLHNAVMNAKEKVLFEMDTVAYHGPELKEAESAFKMINVNLPGILSIPKNIFQTHEYEYSELPEFMKAITETWIKMNPTWNYVYMGAKERRAYVESFYPELIEMYDRLSKMYQADMWRYIITYINGGCYADMDSICIKNLDKMLDEKYTDQEMVCADIFFNVRAKTQKEVQHVNNANFMSIKNSNILKSIINQMIEQSTDTVLMKWPTLYVSFSENILKNRKKVLFKMDNVCMHDKQLKESSSQMIESFVGFP